MGYEELSNTISNDEFWKRYAECAKELEGVQTVDKVIEICFKHFDKSSGEAFFPGGSGDVEILSVLLDAGWKPAWIEASYYFGIYEPGGFPGSSKGLHYVEGDLYKGVGKAL